MSEQIYIDMDGVIADFDAAIMSIFDEPFSSKIADEFWKKTCVDSQVFRFAPYIQEGMRMVNAIIEAGYPICFMTSTGGMPHHIDIATQKLAWLHNHGLGSHPVAFCMNTLGKGMYAYPGAILIDDRQKVYDAWSNRHGVPILFERENAIKIVNRIKILVRKPK